MLYCCRQPPPLLRYACRHIADTDIRRTRRFRYATMLRGGAMPCCFIRFRFSLRYDARHRHAAMAMPLSPCRHALDAIMLITFTITRAAMLIALFAMRRCYALRC